MPHAIHPPATSRAAQAELERRKVRLVDDEDRPTVASGPRTPDEKKKGGEPQPQDHPERKEKGGKGAGRKDDVKHKPEDQRGRADPKPGEGRGAY